MPTEPGQAVRVLIEERTRYRVPEELKWRLGPAGGLIDQLVDRVTIPVGDVVDDAVLPSAQSGRAAVRPKRSAVGIGRPVADRVREKLIRVLPADYYVPVVFEAMMFELVNTAVHGQRGGPGWTVREVCLNRARRR